ncbi:hypothetical protein C8R43DRAFT_1132578 [Mycena crocata]|nr:hypothetical protein C8R43DRAFT_1132578 [Mycena crocata]
MSRLSPTLPLRAFIEKGLYYHVKTMSPIIFPVIGTISKELETCTDEDLAFLLQDARLAINLFYHTFIASQQPLPTTQCYETIKQLIFTSELYEQLLRTANLPHPHLLDQAGIKFRDAFLDFRIKVALQKYRQHKEASERADVESSEDCDTERAAKKRKMKGGRYAKTVVVIHAVRESQTSSQSQDLATLPPPSFLSASLSCSFVPRLNPPPAAMPGAWPSSRSPTPAAAAAVHPIDVPGPNRDGRSVTCKSLDAHTKSSDTGLGITYNILRVAPRHLNAAQPDNYSRFPRRSTSGTQTRNSTPIPPTEEYLYPALSAQVVRLHQL